MSLFKAVSEKSSDKKIKKIFEDIKRKRKISKIPNFWRALANDPKTLERTWESLQQVMKKKRLEQRAFLLFLKKFHHQILLYLL